MLFNKNLLARPAGNCALRGDVRTLVTAKWSVRADREEQFMSDFQAYERLESAGRDFGYVLITNEFDAARLRAACERGASLRVSKGNGSKRWVDLCSRSFVQRFNCARSLRSAGSSTEKTPMPSALAKARAVASKERNPPGCQALILYCRPITRPPSPSLPSAR
jgi:hypothetical protein